MSSRSLLSSHGSHCCILSGDKNLPGCHRSWQGWNAAAFGLAGHQRGQQQEGLAGTLQAGRGSGSWDQQGKFPHFTRGQTEGKRDFTSHFVGIIFFPLARFSQKLFGILSVCQSSCDFFISLTLLFFFFSPKSFC